ncbi:elicitor-responsive protein 1 [Dioscorea cayenensis subsp. rotundata]|uniref:Elicitor-responsive protein 1 n=1 Tax=Dioscorea cayennensis subsp. rotundata TaxID=55577 RepID=A0AB40CZW0_DIOCR|nr:elicitor-responsive protein 1 [Dioscorea cayenensis subsp. rotundata]
MAMVSGIQGQLLDVTVVRCSKLKDTEWISRQDPYVCLEYASTKFRTRTCTDGGKNPVFQEKINIPLIEGLREITVTVWNSNTITFDDFIGTGRIQLQKVLSQGYDDSSWPLQSKSGKFAGEVTVIMHFANAKKGDKASLAGHALTHPTHMPTAPPVASYAPPPSSYAPAYPSSVPPGPSAGYPPPYGAYPSQPPMPYSAGYPPASYPATSYAPPPMPQAYPPQTYPPAAYPPQPYPPPPHAQPYYPPGSYPGSYPPY